MKIGFCTQPLSDLNNLRGVGVYTKNLKNAINSLEFADFELVEFTKDIPKSLDLIHYPFFDPFFLTLPIYKKHKTIVTIHDLMPIIFRRYFPSGLKGEIKWQIQKISLMGVEAIITDSKNSQKDIAKITGFSPDRIFPIHLAAGSDLKPADSDKKLQVVMNKYSLPQDYILYVGDVNWNKNVLGLLESMAMIIKKHPGLKLVFVGKTFLNNEIKEVSKIKQIATENNLTDCIRYLGFVDQKDLYTVYSLAKVTVLPSFYEGFGLPVLEALHCGCPVACANTSCLKEVGGDAVLYFDPYSTKEIANAVLTILNYSFSQRLSVSQKGQEWEKNFHWRKTAQETLNVYKKVFYD